MKFNLIFFLFFYFNLSNLINFTLQKDKNQFLILTNSSSIYRLDENDLSTSLILNLPRDYNVKNLDYSYKDRLLFWINQLDSSVNVHHIDTGKKRKEFLKCQYISPEDLSIDWLTKKIYWLFKSPYRIEVSDYNCDNSSLIILLSNQTPRSIVVAPLSGFLFWSDLERETISRVSMNGDVSTVKEIVNGTKAHTLTVDHNLKKLYWSDINNSKIKSTDFNGQYKRNVISTYTPTVTTHNGNVYFLNIIEKIIYSVDSIGRSKKNKLIDFEELSTKLSYFSERNQPSNKRSECLINNGGCSNLCLLSSESPFYTCSCPTGIPLDEDKKTCKTFPTTFILIALKNQINYISLDSNNQLARPTKIKDQENITSVDFDPIDQRIYWIDKNKVKSAFLNGTNEKLITECDLEYERLKIDVKNRNIYLVKNLLVKPKDIDDSYSANSSIEVVSLDGKFKKTLIDDFIDKPRAIAVDAQNQFFYWSDWSSKYPKIERVSFDLKIRQKIISKDISWPNGIAIDNELNRLYWCDAKPDKYRIEYSDLDGSNRKILVKLDKQLVDITLMGDYIYWLDQMKDQIGKVHKLNGKFEIVSIQNLGKIMGLSAVSNNGLPVSKLLNINKNCSQLSLSDDLCTCSDGFELQTNSTNCLLGNNTCDLNRGGCDQNCNQIIGNYRKCSCEADSYLDLDQKSCIQRNTKLPMDLSCKFKNRCSHYCLKLIDSYHCSCPEGMYLHKDGYKCIDYPVASIVSSTINGSEFMTNQKMNEEGSSSVTLIIVCLLTISTIVIFILIALNYLIRRKKETEFDNSKENIIQNKRKMDFGYSLSNVESSILYDREVAGTSFDENRSLMMSDPPPSPNSSSVKLNYLHKFDRNNLIFKSDLNDDFDTNTSISIDRLANDDDTNSSNIDLFTKENSCIYVPAPIFRDELFKDDNANFKENLISKDYLTNDHSSESILVLEQNYPNLKNPPNSPSNSIHRLNFKKYEDF